MDPVAHGRETWSQLPTFARRRMAAAKPISLMAVPDYEIRSQLAHAIYADASPDAAARTAHQLGIAYLFIGPDEERANPRESLAKFDRRPDLFRRVFSNSRTRIYERPIPRRPCAVILLLSRACSRFDRRHLYRNCRRHHRRALGAGLYSALRSCDRPRLASRSRALRQASGRLGLRRVARVRHHVPGLLGRPRAAHSIRGDVPSRVGPALGSNVVRLRVHGAAPAQ